ncbi:reverse transcriptase domain-containing protein [Tanacetum coccineum]
MVQPWQRVTRQRITQSFSPDPEISFPPLEEEEGTEGPMIIEAEIGGHFIHRMYVDDGGEIIWPLGQISLLVKIGYDEHSTSAWMNFVIVRSSSPYNGIIGRPGVRKIQSVSSTAHGMLKFPIAGGILTLKCSKIIPIECAAISGPEGQPSAVNQAIEERIKKKYTKKSNFHWTEEAESAFKQMKQLIAKLSMLIAPEEKEELIVYLTTTKEAPRLKRSRSELHINGKIGPGTSTCQQAFEKILPSTPNYSGHGPTHKASVVKTKNFIVERPEEDSLDTPMEIEEELPEPWILFEETNNEAEYEALIAGLRIAEQMGVKNLQANVDSGLVANQVNETYIAKEADMIRCT